MEKSMERSNPSSVPKECKRNHDIEELAQKNRCSYSWASSILYGTRLSPSKMSNDHDKKDEKKGNDTKVDILTKNDELISSFPPDESISLLQQNSNPQLYFDLHLPDHETKTPMSQITMDGMEWMDDLYQEYNSIAQESIIDVDDAKTRWTRSMNNGIDLARKEIALLNEPRSYLPTLMKRSSSAVPDVAVAAAANVGNSNVHSTKLWSEYNDTKSPLRHEDYSLPHTGVSTYRLEPTSEIIIRRQTMLKEWRDFVNEQRIYASETNHKCHQETIPTEIPSQRYTKDKRDSKNKGRNMKSRKGGRKEMDEMARSK